MYRWLSRWMAIAGTTLLVTQGTFAADLTPSPVEPEAPLAAGPFDKPVDDAKNAIDEKKSEAKLKQEARLKALEDAQSSQKARIVVLKWDKDSADHTTETLQRNIKARLARPDSSFYPEIDLYQAGRKERDRTVRPGDQRAVVPDESIAIVQAAVDKVSTIPWDGLSEQDWGLKANDLRLLADEIWFVDRPELREPLFKLYLQIGRAAENANTGSPPYFEQISGQTVNYYWYLAATLTHEDPGMLSQVTDEDMHSSISYLKDQLDAGSFQPMTLSFEMAGEWDMKQFASEYQLFINGLEVLIDDPKGLYPAAPGRVDVSMRRSDGFSLSDRIELDKLDDKIYGVRDTARQRMGVDFRDQLMEHPNECTPQLDGDILNYLAIYAKLHPEADISIALPMGGSANKILLWRWDRATSTLQKVYDNFGFPVRFAVLAGVGTIFNGASTSAPDADAIAAAEANGDPIPSPDFTPTLSGIPVYYHLRGHYSRLLVETGMEYAANVTGNPWTSSFQTRNGKDNDFTLPKQSTCPDDPGDLSCTPGEDYTTNNEQLRERTWQRLVFVGFGVVLGKDAAVGFGPRGLIRVGWYNTPHTVDLTGHIGISTQAPFSKADGRVRPLLDVDMYGGAMLPFPKSSLYTPGNKDYVPIGTFGASLGAGFTF